MALIDWDLNSLEKAVGEMYINGPDGEKMFRALSCPGDICDPAMAKEIVAHVEKYFGGISFVVSCAGEETFQVARAVAAVWSSKEEIWKDQRPKAIVNVIKKSSQAYPLASDVESRKLGIRTNALRPLMEDGPDNEAAVAKAALWLLSSESSKISDNSIVMAGI